jgi:hypothetical protein
VKAKRKKKWNNQRNYIPNTSEIARKLEEARKQSDVIGAML